MKQKLDDFTKAKLIYSGELIIIALVFLVLGILRITGVMAYNPDRRVVFNYITLVGFCWGITDFIWTLVSKKRRAKNCLLDKCLVLPLSIYLGIFDLICLLSPTKDDSFYIIGICIVFFYVFIIYTFEGIYHFYKPIPLLLEELNKEEQEEKKEN